MAYRKVRLASRAPGLFFLSAALGLAACNPQGADKEPAAQVDLRNVDDAEQAQTDQPNEPGDAPGFASVSNAQAPAASATIAAPDGEQMVSGTIIDFLCVPDMSVRVAETPASSACELVIRTETRGDRRLLCDIAPCDVWVERGSLPQGIRGLQAEAWYVLADRFDPSGKPAGRAAKVTRLTVAYSKAKG